ncbi:MAG TPA: D-2-hydroxyacid dehydrogenase [Thermoguttaceae bacterium]|nr:D-2-hydroxyacid dehydrogenase [Thermoguttaceae bacterium]
MQLVLCYPVEPRHIDQIQCAVPDHKIINAGQQHVAEALLEADLFCGHPKVPVAWDAVVRQGRLRWIQSSAAGMDHCLVPSVVASDIVVTSASGVLSDQVAEHTLGLIIAWCRSLPVFFRAQQKHEFIRRPTRDLTGSTVGIVGMGAVGRRLSQVLRPFRVRIIATDVFPVDPPAGLDAFWPADRLDDLLAQSDVVILAAPLNDSTRGMITAAALARMRQGTLLVNAARGPLVRTDALIDALTSGHLAGAVMDVTDPEPLPADHPLWDMPNVIITPHVAGQARWRIDRMTDLLCENLRRWQSGEPLINYLEDKSLGFPIRGSCYPLWDDFWTSHYSKHVTEKPLSQPPLPLHPASPLPREG